MFKLVIQDDEGKTTVVPLIRDEITIGRKEGNTIRLTERNVSRRHARILRSDNEVQIEDLGSYNGIRVNNARIAERVSLRISDQVQIGDYKLYLKAEGVEQVDDARTMPIERIEALPGAAVSPQQAAAAAAVAESLPTTPMPVQRVPLAVADTDPAGRPVATAAQVAALTAPAGYGKLVVMSSNFAGRELELTRPQMIIGRTDENDLVMNHRSISRNHAKVTRDPETQRYTISDLQSSNGVRVNGQDYGKVELRRGDVVDLGHVRMRFVEPGEDFVFSRDAVINDVPEASGGKRGMLVGLVLAVVVLGGIAAYFVLKKPAGENHGGGDNGGNTGQVANPNNGNNANNANNGANNGNPNPGSNVAMADTTDAAVQMTAPTGSNQTNPPSGNTEIDQLRGECMNARTEKNWSSLGTCATQLDNVKAGAGKEYHDVVKLELAAQAEFDQLQSDLGDKNLKSATKHYGNIPAASVYGALAKNAIDAKRAAIIADAVAHAKLLAKSHKCDELDKYDQQQASSYGEDVGMAVQQVKCEAQTAVVAPPPPQTDCSGALLNPRDARCKQQFCSSHAGNAACVSEAAPAQNCDQMKEDGDKAEGSLDHPLALKRYEQAFACSPSEHTGELAYMAACNMGNVGRARVWWKKLPDGRRNTLLQICQKNNITQAILDQ